MINKQELEEALKHVEDNLGCIKYRKEFGEPHDYGTVATLLLYDAAQLYLSIHDDLMEMVEAKERWGADNATQRIKEKLEG